MSPPELHFGASVVLGAAEVAAEGRWLEELGYEYLAAGEHFMRGNPPGPSHAALPLLAVAAGATENIRLLSSILLLPFYHPLTLAKLTATLDIAAGGRLTLGVGVGGEFPEEFAAAGLNVKERGRRANEGLALLRRLWSESGVSYSGRHFQLDNVALNPPPTQRPGPPVWVAGRRAAAMRRAARYGDGWLPYFYSPQRYQDSVAQIIKLAADTGRDLAAFQWAFFPYIAIYPTEQEAAEAAAQALGGRYRYGGDFLNIVRNYCLLGTPQQCIDRLQEYIDAGARHIIFSVACPREERVRHIETIAAEILPHFRSRR